MNIQVYPLTSLIKIEKMMKTYLFITNSSELLFSKTYITCTIPPSSTFIYQLPR